ncbi:MAG: hypothetical protein WEC59_10550 [Salibacteraceae bacterium]
MINPEDIKQLETRLNALKDYLDIDHKRGLIADEEQKTMDPHFWDDPKEAEGVLKQINKKMVWS